MTSPTRQSWNFGTWILTTRIKDLSFNLLRTSLPIRGKIYGVGFLVGAAWLMGLIARFYDIAWGQPSEDHPRGIIAGALENGSLDLWDAEKLISGATDALISRTTKHTGAIKSLQFNPLRPQILATAGAKGELFIYDVKDPESAFRLGTAAARSDDIECVAWNTKVSHILATGGTGGFVTVWDLKTKKASLTLNNNRKPVSSIAWDPNNSTKLLTATPDDTTPVILLWDLRNSNAPERTLQGHEQGVLSVSWCQQDGDILISCGKDNRTLIWDPQTGERYGEFPEVTNWAFLTRFHPNNPNLSATAAFDGKITIQTLQNTNPSAAQNTTQTHLDGEDFFTQAQTQPQGAAFSLTKAPKWLEVPVGVSFGFGGKIVMFKQNPSQAGQKRSSKIQISQFSVDSDITSATQKFEESLNSGDLAAICESHQEQATTEDEKADWRVMETLLSENPRKEIVDFLGFSEKDIANGTTAEEAEKELEEEADEPEKSASGVKTHKKRISTFFADGPDTDGEDFLASLSATKGAKTDNPFQLFSESDSAVEKQITKALILGNFEKATEICLDEGRMADAFIIANCGGKDLVDRVQSAYLSQKTGMPNYLRLLGSVIVKNLWDVVYNADLADWRETMVTLCTFADPTEFPDLCEALGDRIYESGSRKDASFCYLVGSKLEKVVDIWIAELAEAEKAGLAEGSDSTFSVHARTLQQFIEKVTVFRHVAKFRDNEADLASGWKLALLYDKYVEYADIVAAHGQLDVAQKYLDLLPTKYPAADMARARVQLATKRASARPVPQQAAQHPVAPARAVSRAQQPAVGGYQPPTSIPTNPSNPYGPPAAQTPAANPYAQSTGPASLPPVSNAYAPTGANPYAPQGYQAPHAQASQIPPPVSGYGAPSAPSFGPPRSSTPSSRPPPPRISDVGNWNDVPVVTRPPPRKNTPSAAPIPSPFASQTNLPGPPPPQSPYGTQRGAGTPPPPPKGPPSARVMSPLGGPPPAGQMPSSQRPGSSASNAYAPPAAMTAPGVGSGLPPPPAAGNFVPRTASPYNPPPAAGPPSNRYAPAPAPQQTSQPPPYPGMAPPNVNRVPPPPNPYAPSPQATPSQSQYAPPPYGAPPAQQRPPPPSSVGPRSVTGSPAPPPTQAAPPPKPRHPPGDRSHIPISAQQLVDVLSRDMQRVAAKAPASFAPQVKDTQKRLGLLFDHLNNGELVKPDTVEELTKLALALEGKDYPEAQRLQVEIQRDKTEECGNWMVSQACIHQVLYRIC
jgi:protein transport protein SEC31